ncbi:PREDICTED: aminopeptidase O-like [Elephantulus edwardii]|uniref:aminopeptidase O-like n=1 Tax=Elephantulus edwardii TaxID=28737 RepID=UPI0003F07EB4|nr:PREDICTED: aminopeptidase O-like [Elephantulus edwardii]
MDTKLNPARDDLPLMANTSHILVKHYVLDLDVDFDNHIFEGTIVLFCESVNKLKRWSSSSEEPCPVDSCRDLEFGSTTPCHASVTSTRPFSSKVKYNEFTICGEGETDTSEKDGNLNNQEQTSGTKCCFDARSPGSQDFLLVLDCCDLSVLKVEEVDVSAVLGIERFTKSLQLTAGPEELRNHIVHQLVTLSADHWREQLDYYARCSQAPGCGELLFATDSLSLQIRKTGAQTAAGFPHAIRIWYRTTPQGGSVTWTSDQTGSLHRLPLLRLCLSSFAARLALGEPQLQQRGQPVQRQAGHARGSLRWHYYVTIPMPASTFTVAVGSWAEIKPEACSSSDVATERAFPPAEADFRDACVCNHMEYPCRFQDVSATTQDIIPHRVFAPVCFKDVCQKTLLPLISPCLSAAHSILGTHPFSRLDVVIVPANFSSLGMASPHLFFLSQSTLTGGSHLCGTRLCHEIAHSWFGLAIGALDWTEEWLSEGFATHLEDVFWTEAQQLSPLEAQEQCELRACLRWLRLQDEVHNSAEEVQVLRPNKEKTGLVTDSGASLVKHGLNPEKTFMQVHYLKGYFLLQFLAKRFGDATYFSFLRKFVQKFHGQLILSQDFLQMLLENIPEEKRLELSVENILQDWLESSGIPKPLQRELQAGTECRLARQVDAEVAKWIRLNQKRRKRTRKAKEELFEKLLPDQLVLLLERLLEEKTLHPRTLQILQQTYHLPKQDAEVRHRWCELIIKHRFIAAYGQVESFLLGDQAMGIYLYGELMVGEDPRQQQLARKCFELTKEWMDRASAQVVAEMLF